MQPVSIKWKCIHNPLAWWKCLYHVLKSFSSALPLDYIWEGFLLKRTWGIILSLCFFLNQSAIITITLLQTTLKTWWQTIISKHITVAGLQGTLASHSLIALGPADGLIAYSHGDDTNIEGVNRNAVLLLKTEPRAGTQAFPPTVYVPK